MTPGTFCPLIAATCKRDRCKFWLLEEMTNTQTGEKKLVPDCLILHAYQLQRQGVVEQIRGIATTDKVAASIDRTGGLMVRAALARRLVALEGGERGP